MLVLKSQNNYQQRHRKLFLRDQPIASLARVTF